MRKIAIVTGTRAEYGLLKPLIQAINEDKELKLQLLVTGTHLMPEFGNTFEEIEADGFVIHAKVEDFLTNDTPKAITEAMGNTIKGFGNVFVNLQPDIVVVLGDRSEILAVVTAAIIATIPVAHIHGGETTEGAYDEYIRHAITKMSRLHFASTEAYRRRIIQMGEHPNKVFNVGALGIDSIRQLQLLGKTKFEESISKKLDQYSVLITFHPVTLENASAERQFEQLLISLDALENTTLIFTRPNSDKDGRIIVKMIDEYVGRNTERAVVFSSLGQLRYLSALQFVDFVIGNSSSGILEVPYFNIPTINIGDRQKGRLMPESVINCPPNSEAISSAICKAKESEFKTKIQEQKHIYGDGHATQKIIGPLKNFNLTNKKKPFYDLTNFNFEKL
ncbi:UDP-N-acetylglucosamine 2-epimerase [Zobellia uliginosa]|uniref:UDP-N-acetylglucosamine 2-epimerase n=1 Tax=Zobellia uliginosa TaxID=143224 RepID=UPI001C070C71|nr:UDP-N-acetylglucosamine 2-epimerase [Zobellia uliginosa]MBU2948254.1 UDP-N-acetylglucosamine 2-epimerase (hydrolyzing) [Zobellia uliginosa]